MVTKYEQPQIKKIVPLKSSARFTAECLGGCMVARGESGVIIHTLQVITTPLSMEEHPLGDNNQTLIFLWVSVRRGKQQPEFSSAFS